MILEDTNPIEIATDIVNIMKSADAPIINYEIKAIGEAESVEVVTTMRGLESLAKRFQTSISQPDFTTDLSCYFGEKFSGGESMKRIAMIRTNGKVGHWFHRDGYFLDIYALQ